MTDTSYTPASVTAANYAEVLEIERRLDLELGGREVKVV